MVTPIIMTIDVQLRPAGFFFFFKDPATPEFYPLPLPDALPIFAQGGGRLGWPSLRASTEHSIRLGPEPINPECAVREHNGQPCHPAPLSCVRDARAREAFRRSEEHTSELQSQSNLVCRLLLEQK